MTTQPLFDQRREEMDSETRSQLAAALTLVTQRRRPDVIKALEVSLDQMQTLVDAAADAQDWLLHEQIIFAQDVVNDHLNDLRRS